MKKITASQSMSAIRRKRLLVLGLLPLVAAALVFALPSGSSASAAMTPEGLQCTSGLAFSLETGTGHVATPDGNSVFMWGYKLTGTSFQMPGPVLCVNAGDSVSVTLTNTLAERTSIVFPGQTGVSGGVSGVASTSPLVDREADVGGSVTYTFTAGQPGTYLYESGTNPSKQTQMGLYGALVVYPSAADHAHAYYDPQTKFLREYLIILNEIDPDQHRAVELGQAYDDTRFNDDYWQVNGRSFPDTISDNGVPWLPNQPYGAMVRVQPYDPVANPLPVLIRYANAGRVNHPFHPHGNHMRVIARDGRLLRGPAGQDASYENFTRTIGSGQTYDLLFRWDDVDAWITSSNPPAGVTIPNLQNLVFKDDATFYSGDPNLDQKGPLPVGTTSYNECGEYYFPWHSHALNEFTNFDEGFGGLATLLRVDPAGGCP